MTDGGMNADGIERGPLLLQAAAMAVALAVPGALVGWLTKPFNHDGLRDAPAAALAAATR